MGFLPAITPLTTVRWEIMHAFKIYKTFTMECANNIGFSFFKLRKILYRRVILRHRVVVAAARLENP